MRALLYIFLCLTALQLLSACEPTNLDGKVTEEQAKGLWQLIRPIIEETE